MNSFVRETSYELSSVMHFQLIEHNSCMRVKSLMVILSFIHFCYCSTHLFCLGKQYFKVKEFNHLLEYFCNSLVNFVLYKNGGSVKPRTLCVSSVSRIERFITSLMEKIVYIQNFTGCIL